MSTYVTRIIEVKLPDIQGEVYKESDLDKKTPKENDVYKVNSVSEYKYRIFKNGAWEKLEECNWSWHLVRYFADQRYGYYIEDDKAYGNLNGFDVKEIYSFCDNGGPIRDTYLSQWYGKKYGLRERGFPSDMSPETKAKIDADCSEYTWDHTYVYLNEWQQIYSSELKEFKHDIKDKFENIMLERIEAKIDKLLDPTLNIQKKLKENKDDDFEYENEEYEYLWEEQFGDLSVLSDEITKIYFIVDQIHGFIPNERIRILYYMS